MPFCADLFFRVYDEGKKRYPFPMILLHGTAGSHLAWPREIRRLSGQQVIALDLPGHGKPPGAACRSMNGLVDHLHQFVRKMGFYQVVLAGHSLGGALALNYALKYPKCIKGLLLLACGSYFYLLTSLFNTLRNPVKRYIALETFNQIAFYENFPQSKRRKILEPFENMRASTILADLSICSEFNLNGNLKNIDCPVGLISGKADQIVAPLAVYQLFHALPTASISILPKCGHMLIHEETILICRIISDFLTSVAAS